MRQRGDKIPRRKPIFFGCEGESEQAYGQHLNEMLRDAGFSLHLEVVTLNPGAGDPIARVQRAKQEIERRQNRRATFYRKVILMDSDQVENDSPRRREAERMAYDSSIRIIWQTPCHTSGR